MIAPTLAARAKQIEKRMTIPRGVGLIASGAAPASSPRTSPMSEQTIASAQMTTAHAWPPLVARDEVVERQLTQQECTAATWRRRSRLFRALPAREELIFTQASCADGHSVSTMPAPTPW